MFRNLILTSALLTATAVGFAAEAQAAPKTGNNSLVVVNGARGGASMRTAIMTPSASPAVASSASISGATRSFAGWSGAVDGLIRDV